MNRKIDQVTLKRGLNQDQTKLDLRESQMVPQRCKEIIEKNLPALEELHLRYNKIGDEGCKYLMKGEWPVLKYLNIGNDNVGITNKGCWYLRQGNWPELQSLNLPDNKITSLTFLCFQRSPQLISQECAKFRNLQVLNLIGNLIQTIQPLSELDAPQLSEIYFRNNRITSINSMNKIKSQNLKEISIMNNLVKEIEGLRLMQLNSLQGLSLNSLYSRKQRNISMKPLARCQFNKYLINVYMEIFWQKQGRNCLYKKYERKILRVF